MAPPVSAMATMSFGCIPSCKARLGDDGHGFDSEPEALAGLIPGTGPQVRELTTCRRIDEKWAGPGKILFARGPLKMKEMSYFSMLNR